MWNKRYARAGYLFGTEPTQFLTRQRAHLTPGVRALAVADGEGRNSVFMASMGMRVTAMDASGVALEKARSLAAAHQVSVDYHEADVFSWDWAQEAYDLVAGIFIQFMGPQQRDQVFEAMKHTLKPGGTVLLHGYTPRQLEFGTGGPGQRENLYTKEILSQAFSDFEILNLKEYEMEIEEGRGHSGQSALIDLVARKPV